jgi:hypothetical protein
MIDKHNFLNRIIGQIVSQERHHDLFPYGTINQARGTIVYKLERTIQDSENRISTVKGDLETLDIQCIDRRNLRVNGWST